MPLSSCSFSSLNRVQKRSFTATPANDYDSDGSTEDDDVENDEKNKEEHKSIKEKLRIIQEVTLSVQNSIGHLASLLESIKKWVLSREKERVLFICFSSLRDAHITLIFGNNIKHGLVNN